MLLPLCWKRNNLYAFWIPIRFANIDTVEFLSKLITIVIWTLDTWNLMSGKKNRLSREDARRRRTRKKWYLGNVVRLRGTWSEGPRGEGGCLELPGALKLARQLLTPPKPKLKISVQKVRFCGSHRFLEGILLIESGIRCFRTINVNHFVTGESLFQS